MSNLIRFTLITVVVILAFMLVLAVGGALSSSQLWHNATKVLELAAILCGAMALIMVFAKK